MTISAWELGNSLGIFLCSIMGSGFVFNQLFADPERNGKNLYLMFITGIIFYYTLLLLELPLDFIIFYSKVFTLCIFYFAIYRIYGNSINIKSSLLQGAVLLLLSVIFVAVSKSYIQSIFYHPISAWDARSIWYFRAKQLMYNNGFSESLGICSEGCTTSFSHSTYHFLVPAISAFISKNAGIWNEFIPKLNLLILLLGLILSVSMLKHVNIFFKISLFLILISVNPILVVNGYLDAWLGIYTATALIFICEFIRTFRKEYLYTGLGALIFITYIKNEGALLCIGILLSTVSIIFLLFGKRFFYYLFMRASRIKYLLLLNTLPLILWAIHKKRLNYFELDFDFSNLADRQIWIHFFSSEKFNMMYNSLIKQSDYITVLVACMFTWLICLWYMVINKRSGKEIKSMVAIFSIPLLTSLIFFLGVCLVYYASEIDLEWHLMTSADRLGEHLIYLAVVPIFYSMYAIKLFPKNTFIFS